MWACVEEVQQKDLANRGLRSEPEIRFSRSSNSLKKEILHKVPNLAQLTLSVLCLPRLEQQQQQRLISSVPEERRSTVRTVRFLGSAVCELSSRCRTSVGDENKSPSTAGEECAVHDIFKWASMVRHASHPFRATLCSLLIVLHIDESLQRRSRDDGEIEAQSTNSATAHCSSSPW